jgi:phosphatidylglycerol:prolipoprotein diacylglycerol transferase
MYPFRINLQLFNSAVEIGPYQLFFFLAITTALIGCYFFSIKMGFRAKKVALILFTMLIAAVIGARALNALVNLESYIQNPAKLFEFSAEGFSLYGGICMAAASAYIMCKKLKIDPFKLGDTLIPFLGISIALMRVGCFCAGCCFGQITNLPWGVKFPLLSPAHLHQIAANGNFLKVSPVHPTQIYELIAALTLTIITFILLKKKLPAGTVALIFLTGFSLFRLFNSYLRVPSDNFTAPPYFYPALYITLTISGLILIWHKLRQPVPKIS